MAVECLQSDVPRSVYLREPLNPVGKINAEQYNWGAISAIDINFRTKRLALSKNADNSELSYSNRKQIDFYILWLLPVAVLVRRCIQEAWDTNNIRIKDAWSCSLTASLYVWFRWRGSIYRPREHQIPVLTELSWNLLGRMYYCSYRQFTLHIVPFSFNTKIKRL